MEVKVSPEVEKKLSEIAEGANIPLETAVTYILDQYVSNPGGAIYAGTWRSAKGMRYVIQWPFLSGFLKLKEDEVVRRD
ncbi:MAG: hypothetical protein HXS41_01170 [Theionarchaea archaeon]|nr:hypothetical protein [Theionarchaea archaeon]MBU6999237.1 hypothetical protein [Theionarchaea archaeon]MBU7019638.1 hypothetical protein [Theionarchaea archaeon]MBU7033816.1 hypothetical protein [Theionarchaea archaeon]MBU7040226.1 hypothetical protein [Theionarchaea archaeon]